MDERLTPEIVKDSVTMWEVLEALDIDHEPAAGGCKVWAIDRPESEASLHVYEDHWIDYGTGRGGSQIDFVMEWFGCSFGHAMQWIEKAIFDGEWDAGDPRPSVAKAERPEVNLIYRLPPSFARADDELVRERWPWISPALLAAFDVRRQGSTLWIPHYAQSDTVTGIKVRDLRTGKKWSVEGSTFRHLYRQRGARQGADSRAVILTEGESDTWAAHHLLVTVTGCSPSVGKVRGLPSGIGGARKTWDLGNPSKVVIAFDNDTAGRQGVEDWNDNNDYPSVRLPIPDGMDLADWVAEDPAKAANALQEALA